MEDRFTAVRLRIERDFAEPRLEFPGLAFRSASGEHPLAVATESWPDNVDPAHLACVSGGNAFSVDSGLGEEELAVFVADKLQDDAMDQIWTPWPTLRLPGGGEAVLEPRLSPSGVGVWTTAAGYSCPIGLLRAAFGWMLS